MAYEMGIKKYEDGMKSMSDKKKTIIKFTDERTYNSSIRTLVRDVVLKENDQVDFRELLKVIDGLTVKTEYVNLPATKRNKK
jgi:hypothetical protein